MQTVYLTGTGHYLPGEPVPPAGVENLLGFIPGLEPRLAAQLDLLRERMLSRGGIQWRHFAMDPQTRRQTGDNVSLAAEACRQALSMAGCEPARVELLVISCPSPDWTTPPTSVLLQERLGIPDCQEIEIHSNCTGMPKALQVALDALRGGRCRRALVVYSQLSSIFLRREFLNPSVLTLENLILRWVLSDGAGAVVLESGKAGGPHPVLLDSYLESTRAAEPAGMTFGVGAGPAAELAGTGPSVLHALYDAGLHHIWQDIGKVSREAAGLAGQGLGRMFRRMGVEPAELCCLILPVPGRPFLQGKNLRLILEGSGLTAEQIPFLTGEFGYCGGAAGLVQLDRMARGSCFRSGDLVALFVEESSKWMTGGCLLRWA